MGAHPRAPGGYPDDVEGLSAATIKTAIQGSLERLGTDRLELYWAHMDDRSVPVEETVGAFGELVAAGVVGRVGASNQATWRVERARQAARVLGAAAYSALQLRYSYLRPRPGVLVHDHPHGSITEETLDYARCEQLDVWAYTPLLEGGYVRPERRHEGYDHPGTTRRWRPWTRSPTSWRTRHQVVLAWLTGADPAITPLVGVTRCRNSTKR